VEAEQGDRLGKTFIGRPARVFGMMDGRQADLGVRASTTRRASRGASAVVRRPWGRDALSHGARHGIEDREERERWEGRG
jgi:hypothetical protein